MIVMGCLFVALAASTFTLAAAMLSSRISVAQAALYAPASAQEAQMYGRTCERAHRRTYAASPLSCATYKETNDERIQTGSWS